VSYPDSWAHIQVTHLCSVCVCVRTHTHTPTYTFTLVKNREDTDTVTPLSFLLSKITPHAKQAKCTVLVIQHHCGQTFGTYLGGWEQRRPVRRGCGARPLEFFEDDFWSIFEKVSWSWNVSFHKTMSLFISQSICRSSAVSFRKSMSLLKSQLMCGPLVVSVHKSRSLSTSQLIHRSANLRHFPQI